MLFIFIVMIEHVHIHVEESRRYISQKPLQKSPAPLSLTFWSWHTKQDGRTSVMIQCAIDPGKRQRHGIGHVTSSQQCLNMN
jgi:hypothetical protein